MAKGREPRSETAITYFADATADDGTRALADMASDVLEIRLRELLREKLGGTYSVSVSYSDTLPDKGYGSIGIDFGSSPENAKSLAADVLKTVAELQKTGPTAEEVHKVVEQERQDLETAARQNGYWLSSLQSSLVTGRDALRLLGRTDALKLITIESLHKAFVRFFPSNRYTVATLMPEAPARAIDSAARASLRRLSLRSPHDAAFRELVPDSRLLERRWSREPASAARHYRFPPSMETRSRLHRRRRPGVPVSGGVADG